MERQNAIYNFWFEGANVEGAKEADVFQKNSGKWFGMGLNSEQKLALDNQIRDLFHDDLEKLGRGEYDSWKNDPKGVTAACILGDQFSRNMHRGTAKAFAFDEKVLEFVLPFLEAGLEKSLPSYEKNFLFMPFMHSERLDLHAKVLAYYEACVAAAPDGPSKSKAQQGLDFEKKHLDIIKQFGRYPHRNDILGRESTPEEIEYLKNAERFGQ